jgi:hypothetical protein
MPIPPVFGQYRLVQRLARLWTTAKFFDRLKDSPPDGRHFDVALFKK